MKRYELTYQSLLGEDWVVEIHDTEFDGLVSVQTFEGERNGCTISYDSSDLFDPIVGSSCSFSFIVDNNTDESFIESVVSSDEERYRIVLRRGGAIEWAGFVVMDEITIQDQAFPYIVNLEAIDGIKRLDSKQYTNETAAFFDLRESMLTHLQRIIEEIGTLDLLGTSTATVLTTNLNWHANFHDKNADPIGQTWIEYEAFYRLDKRGNVRADSYFEVLQKIARCFGARFIHSRGRYYLMQAVGYDASTQDLYHYSITALKSKQQDVDFKKLIDYDDENNDRRKLNGGIYRFTRPVSTVNVNYEHKSAKSLLRGYSWQTSGFNDQFFQDAGAQDILSRIIVPTGLNFVQLDITINTTSRLTYTNFDWIPAARWRIIFKLKIGDRTLNRLDNSPGNLSYDPREMSWSTDTDAAVQIYTPNYWEAHNGVAQDFSFAFSTPNIPNSISDEPITVDFDFELVDYNNNLLDLDSSNYDLTYSIRAQDIGVEIIGDGDDINDETTTQYSATIDNTNVGVLDTTTHLGQGPYEYSFTSLRYLNTGIAAEWKRNNSGTARTISDLLAYEMLSLYKKALRIYEGTYSIPDLRFIDTVQDGQNVFLPIRATYNTFYDQWDGEYQRISRSVTGISINEPINLPFTPPPVNPINPIFNPFANVGVFNNEPPETPRSAQVSDLSMTAGQSALLHSVNRTTVMSPVDGFASKPEFTIGPNISPALRPGTRIRIIDPMTGLYENLTVAADHNPATQKLKVVETITRNYPAGSLIQIDHSGMCAQQFSQTFTNETGVDLVITAGTLHDPALLGTNEIHRRITVIRNGLIQLYGVDYQIVIADNKLTFTNRMRRENLLILQQ